MIPKERIFYKTLGQPILDSFVFNHASIYTCRCCENFKEGLFGRFCVYMIYPVSDYCCNIWESWTINLGIKLIIPYLKISWSTTVSSLKLVIAYLEPWGLACKAKYVTACMMWLQDNCSVILRKFYVILTHPKKSWILLLSHRYSSRASVEPTFYSHSERLDLHQVD